jgi:hypothetical protein
LFWRSCQKLGNSISRISLTTCPDLKMTNMNFHRRKTGRTFWVHMNNSMCHNGSKITSKFAKHHLSRMPHPPYSPDTSPCDLWLFGLSERESSEEEEELGQPEAADPWHNPPIFLASTWNNGNEGMNHRNVTFRLLKLDFRSQTDGLPAMNSLHKTHLTCKAKSRIY